MAKGLVLKNIGRVVTCTPDDVPHPFFGDVPDDLGAIDGAAIVAQNGRVAWVGPESDLPSEFADLPTHDCEGRLVTPGLIDCHTHPAFVRARADEFAMRMAGADYEEIAAAGGGILSSMRAVREADDATLLAETTRNLKRLRRHGVVYAEAKSGYGLSLKEEARQLTAITEAAKAADMGVTKTCLAAHSVPPEYRDDPAKYLDHVIDEILPYVAENGLAERVDVFCERGVFDANATRRLFEAAKALGLRTTVHAEQLSNAGGTRVGAECGSDSADHLEYLSVADMKAAAEAGVAAVLLPGSTYALKMNRWADARAMQRAGLCLALATDFNPGSSPIANPAFVMNLAVMRLGMTPTAALAGFTVNAAYALRQNPSEWGAIAIGSRAAFSIWDVESETEIPYYAGSNLCIEVLTCDDWLSA